MKKIVFYCQYLTGMGHLVRSMEIVRSLVKEFKVYFINGGPRVEGFKVPAGVEVINLPALWLEDGKFQIADGCQSVEEVKEIRKNQLIDICDRIQPDCLITEFFPFGRHKLFFELLPLLEYVDTNLPNTKIVCSLRDVIGRETLSEEADIICQLINQYFDLILFHSDPNFLTFEASFPRYQELKCQIEYTGFVAQTTLGNVTSFDNSLTKNQKKEPLILVSVGGGRLGYELLESVIEASKILENKIPHHIQIFTGPFMPDEQFVKLEAAALNRGNVNLQRYTPQLLSYMERSDLSISLTGYNTTMNILRTGVRAIVVPIGHYDQDLEQLVRTRKLEQMGIVEVIHPNNLEPIYLAHRIIACLEKEPVENTSHIFDLEGAWKSTTFLKQYLDCDVNATFAA
ncbi:glycosyl transferase [Scytonema sp. UIC 10036]|uniref:glycosyltransferase family protein n=1 Tax=Scytonema sp. UIC 10036 TaxID=2304196 RepID=UPI0012DABC6B|nr:glycosyltransferase [Scytonema sp. UIC 10036]MUG96379.1 glycosyl transferase [Scytonema sp. UIC 10036]